MSNYPLLSVMGIEIEYMLVDKQTLDIKPLSDLILRDLAGKIVNQVDLGPVSVSNELVLHVLELKDNGPKPREANRAKDFQATLNYLRPFLDQYGLIFLPTGAHPWMDPVQETKRWLHDNHQIYHQYDKIFNCHGHGWSNLQSMHINLPFASDEDFKRLHNAIRLILPLLPALAASTPFLDGLYQGYQCHRLVYYDQNQAKIPAIGGSIIPEFIENKSDYVTKILNPMYAAIKPYDPEGILRFEWLNSRAAIAKFDFNAIEIRIIDSQECVQADIAIAKTIWSILHYWVKNNDYYLQKPIDTKALSALYNQTKIKGLETTIGNPELLKQWQIQGEARDCRAVWNYLIDRCCTDLDKESYKAITTILSQGNLSSRMIKACQKPINKQHLYPLYRQLSECLINNQQFLIP